MVITKNPNQLYPRLEASSISKKLMEQICEYFNEIGINCKIYKRKVIKWKGFMKNGQYRIQANGLKNLNIFHEKVGFLNPKHEERFKSFMTAKGIEPLTSAS